MCGIAGASLAVDEVVDARALATELLLDIDSRGGHATGAAYFTRGEARIDKAPGRAPEFVRRDFAMGPKVTNFILHTRFGTHGPASRNVNNHPIDVGGIIGVHNGVIWNDDALFARIGADKRLAEVDSEAIFATLLHGREKAPDALARVEGSAAVAWLETYGDPDVLHLSRISRSPLVFAFTEAGSLIFASTAAAIRRATIKTGLAVVGGPYELEEGVYLRVRNGEILTRLRFEPFDRAAVPLTDVERKALNLA